MGRMLVIRHKCGPVLSKSDKSQRLPPVMNTNATVCVCVLRVSVHVHILNIYTRWLVLYIEVFKLNVFQSTVW